MASATHLRVARPTNNIAALIPFYCDGLGFSELFRFQDHDGFDGVMLGAPKSPYHFEFTTKTGHDAGRAPTQDNLLVFYLPDKTVHEAAINRMVAAGISAVPAFNPYWDVHGKTFEDADGYRVVLAHKGYGRYADVQRDIEQMMITRCAK
ncbi:prolyl endopeptidase [Ophiostoma piceae UAMH 11346]|uniref:Prolyl endopeptidase n=1 Tax=Ophiostoma piceae (strain UAMH 11346) TaxID=1262450 RepID=S3BWF0_OPHP1|nr:prolyl endopeptidase [Ophiostoma piceae UAMH 11346]